MVYLLCACRYATSCSASAILLCAACCVEVCAEFCDAVVASLAGEEDEEEEEDEGVNDSRIRKCTGARCERMLVVLERGF